MRTTLIAVLTLVFLGSSPALAFPQQGSPTRREQVDQHKLKAQEYLQQNKPDLAIPEFKAIVALEPNNVDARGNLGVLYFFKGSLSEAIPHLRAALKLQPSLSKIQALLGTAEARTGDTKKALSDLEKAFPHLAEKKIRIDTGLQLIELYSATGDLDKAASTVGALRELDPTNVTILYTAYRIYSDLTDEARLSLSVAAPQSGQMHQMMAHELAKQGNNQAAIANYREAIKLAPQLPGIHFELAEMLNAASPTDNAEEVEKEYQLALAANPSDEKSESRLADIASRKNNLPEAFTRYSRALQLQPDDPDGNVGLAKVLMSMNQSEKAEALLKRAIQLDPTIALAHFRLSTIYRQTGRTDQAQQELAEYQKYKEMKEKLREMYHGMSLNPGVQDLDDADTRN